MEFVIDKKRLDAVISLLSNFVERKDSTSALANIFISAQGDELQLKATDGELGIIYHCRGVQVKASGQSYVSARKLNDILKGLDSSDLKLKASEKKLNLSQKKTKFSIPIASADDAEFAFLDANCEREQVNINAAALNKGLKLILPAIDNNSISRQFNCAHIEISPEIMSFVGSDSKIVSIYEQKRLADSSAGADGGSSSEHIIVSKRVVSELLKLLGEEVRAYKNENFFILENDNFTFFARLISVQPLPYRAVMPKQPVRCEPVLPRASFISEIKKLSAISDKTLLSFITPNTLRFASTADAASDDAVATSEIEGDFGASEDFEIYLSNRYMLDFLSLCEDESFKIYFFQEGAPVIFSSLNGEFKALIASIKK